MREGGKRYVVASPGPMQRQGTKSLLWVVGLSQALEEAGGKPHYTMIYIVYGSRCGTIFLVFCSESSRA
jgi:hypothetical protein